MNALAQIKLDTAVPLGSNGLFDRVMAYENAEVIERYKDKLGLSHGDAEKLFNDVKRFLYICGTRPGIWCPTDKIDDGWHEFLLYTRDYADFCANMFGRFLHHVPRSYIDTVSAQKGRAWATHLVARDIFDNLSENWDVPENRRPRVENGQVLDPFEFDRCGNCSSGCGCNAD